jgi:hypothetical protein
VVLRRVHWLLLLRMPVQHISDLSLFNVVGIKSHFAN